MKFLNERSRLYEELFHVDQIWLITIYDTYDAFSVHWCPLTPHGDCLERRLLTEGLSPSTDHNWWPFFYICSYIYMYIQRLWVLYYITECLEDLCLSSSVSLSDGDEVTGCCGRLPGQSFCSTVVRTCMFVHEPSVVPIDASDGMYNYFIRSVLFVPYMPLISSIQVSSESTQEKENIRCWCRPVVECGEKNSLPFLLPSLLITH